MNSDEVLNRREVDISIRVFPNTTGEYLGVKLCGRMVDADLRPSTGTSGGTAMRCALAPMEQRR